MKRAPRNRELLLLVPTGETETPLTREVGWWDAELKRWEGDWRYYDGPVGYAKAEPIGWAELPEIDAEFLTPPAGSLVPATRADAGTTGAKLATAQTGIRKAGKRAAPRVEKRPTPKDDQRPAKTRHRQARPGADQTQVGDRHVRPRDED
jgi:hypothetical protein